MGKYVVNPGKYFMWMRVVGVLPPRGVVLPPRVQERVLVKELLKRESLWSCRGRGFVKQGIERMV